MKNQDKKIYGLIGYPVKHSLSPAMHKIFFEACGVNAEYKLFEIESKDLESFLSGSSMVRDTEGKEFSSAKIKGFNITVPHKVSAFLLVKEKTTRLVDPLALVANAINTVKRQDGRLDCYNTDITGFMKSLRENLKFNTENKSVLVIGCGGAARAIVAGLTTEGTNIKKIYLYDLKKEAADSAIKHFDKFPYIKEKLVFVEKDKIGEILRDCQLLVNATPIGMKESDPILMDPSFIHSNLLVYDLIYNPSETKLLKAAREKGARISNGLGMLLYQGAAAFEFWHDNIKIPHEVIEIARGALEKEAAKLCSH